MRVQALLRAVQRRERSTFHDWLAATRKAAAVVGERAIRRSAGERAHEDRLGQERKMLLGALPCPPYSLAENKRILLDAYHNILLFLCVRFTSHETTIAQFLSTVA